MWEIKGKDNQVKATVGSLEYNGEWMGESYVTVTVESPAPVNFEIGDYIIYRDERFEINYNPGKIKSAPRYEKGDAFKYENIKFNSLADELTRCDFRDVVLQDNNLHFTSLPKFPFYGGVKDLANRIQANLDKLYTGANKWSVVVSPEFQSDKELNVQVDNIKVQGALEILVNQFETYYTITGRTITIGAAGIPAGHLFKYGRGNGLYEIEQNAEADQAIVTRLRAYGSTRNLPHRYYNSLSGADGKKLIPDNMAVQYLMLPEFPYTTQDPYIDSPNIAKLGIREGTVFFDGSGELEEIYPSIEGMTAEQLKAAGVPCNSTGALDEIVSAEQMTDNGVGEINEGETQTTAKPPTFKVTLKDLGFDINDHLTTETATLSFKTGMLGGRNFEIVKNGCKPIKDASGKVTGYELEMNRVYDDDIKLWFPYSAYNAQAGDKFVLLYIEMPEVYIKAAAQRLKEAATEWLSKNDYSRSIYAPKVDEIFMARQHDLAMASGGKIKSLHDTLKEGMLLLFEDEDLNIDASIFIDRLTIKEEGAVPTYEVVLKEEKTVGTLQKMQNKIDSLAAGMGQGGGGYNASQIRSMIETYGDTRFLSKLKDDRSQGQIASDKAIEVGDFLAGVSGAKIGKDAETGQTFGEMDRLFVRIKAYFETLTIINADSLAGEQRITPGGGVKCTSVETLDNVYRCYFLSEQDGEKTETKIIAGDQAIAQMFNAKTEASNKVSNHRYWRLVTAVSNDAYTDDSGNRYGYIDLSKTDCEKGSDMPQAGDTIVQFGNRTDRTRQAAMVFSTVDANAPSIKLLTGIGSGETNTQHYSLEGKDVVSYGYDAVKGNAYFNCYGDTYIGDPDGSTFIRYDRATKQLDIKAKLSVQSTIGDKNINDYITGLIPELKQEDIEGFVNAIMDPKIDGIQDQIDGVIESFFGFGAPTLDNYPANEWTTDEARKAHERDTYTDKTEYVDDKTTPTAGQSWKWQYTSPTDYGWVKIADSDAVKALLDASKAQDTANSKRRTFTDTPSPPYDEGDMWVNAWYPLGAGRYKYRNDILRCETSRAKGDSFNIDDWELASKYTDDTKAQEAIESIKGYEYLKEAIVNGATQVIGGLFLSSHIRLGEWDKSNPDNPVFNRVYAGMNGVWLDSKGDRSIAAWYGGDMEDPFDYNAQTGRYVPIANPDPATRYAASAFRMDGSMYLAKGNLIVQPDGFTQWGKGSSAVTISPDGKVTLGNGIEINVSGSAQGLGDSIERNWVLINAIANLFDPYSGDEKLSWGDVTKEGRSYDSVKVNVGLWTDFFLSARGDNPNGSGGGGATELRQLDDVLLTNPASGQALVYNGSKWVNQAIATGLDEAALGNYLTTHKYAKISDIPSLDGYATQDWVNGRGFLTQHQSLANYVTLDTAQVISGVKTFTGEVIATDKWITAKIITGETGSVNNTVQSKKSHGIELGYPNRDYMNFNEFGGVFNFYKTNLAYTAASGNGTLVASITERGITAASFIRRGGTSSQFLKADGSVDSNTYLTSHQSLANYYTKSEVDAKDKRLVTYYPSRPTTANVNFGNNAGLYTFLATSSMTSGKPAGDGHILHMEWDNSLAWAGQIAVPNNGDMQWRYQQGNTWQAWRTILDSNNYASIADTRYVKKTGDTMNGQLTLRSDTQPCLKLDSVTAGREVYMYVYSGGVAKTAVGWNNVHGSYIYNSPSNRYLGIKDNGTPHFQGNTIWHAGNDGSRSGLDADLLDGFHKSDIYDNVTAKLSSLNDVLNSNGIRIYGFGFGDSASVANKPAGNNDARGTIGFGGIYCPMQLSWQYLGTDLYIRTKYDGTWKGWKRIAFTTDNVASATRLQTPRTLWGQSFDGTQDVSGDMTGVRNINTVSAPIGTIYASNWFRSTGNTGWYSETYGGGWYMTNTQWIRNFGNKGLYMGTAIIRTDFYYDREGYGGAAWYNGYGAYNTAIVNNSGQTPLMVAYRSGQSPAVTGANRLFSLELLNTGTELRFFFGGFGNGGGCPVLMTSYGELRVGRSIQSTAWFSDSGQFRANATGTNYSLGMGAATDGYAVIQGGNSGTGAIPLLLNPKGGKVGVNTSSPAYALDVNGIVRASDSIISTGWDQFRAIGGNYGFFIRNDGAHTYFMLTNSGDAYGSYNSLRPMYIVNSSGVVAFASNTLMVDPDGYASVNGTFYASVGIWTDGFLSARGENTSDIRLKTGVTDFNATDIIRLLRPVAFRWNDTARGMFRVFDTDDVQYGLIAQEVLEAAPWLVDGDMFGDGYMGVRYNRLIPVLLQGELEILRVTDDHESRIKELERENIELRNIINELQTNIK